MCDASGHEGVAAVSPRERIGRAVRGGLVLGLVALFLTVGLPRFLAGDVAPPTASRAQTDVAKLCRAHGGTARTPPGSQTNANDRTFCTVRYGGRVYRMDAITPDGFDADTAHFQRLGCEDANRQHPAGDGRRPVFVYHPITGVCERRS